MLMMRTAKDFPANDLFAATCETYLLCKVFSSCRCVRAGWAGGYLRAERERETRVHNDLIIMRRPGEEEAIKLKLFLFFCERKSPSSSSS